MYDAYSNKELFKVRDFLLMDTSLLIKINNEAIMVYVTLFS